MSVVIYLSLILFPVSMTLVLTLDISVHLVCVCVPLGLQFFCISSCSHQMLFSNSVSWTQFFTKYSHDVSKHSWKIWTNYLTLPHFVVALQWLHLSVVIASARSKPFENCRFYLASLIHFSPNHPSFHGLAPC